MVSDTQSNHRDTLPLQHSAILTFFTSQSRSTEALRRPGLKPRAAEVSETRLWPQVAHSLMGEADRETGHSIQGGELSSEEGHMGLWEHRGSSHSDGAVKAGLPERRHLCGVLGHRGR